VSRFDRIVGQTLTASDGDVRSAGRPWTEGGGGEGPFRSDSPGAALPRWRRLLVPQVTSERHAMRALVVGFLMEAATEIYQLLTTVGSLHGDPLGYYVGLGITVFGFYFLWRGMHEWNRLNPRPVRTGRRPVPWAAVSMLVGGLVATALLNIILGTVGGGDSPPPLAWVVGGVMVVAFGSFFLALRRMVAPLQNPTGRVLGWAAFAWSLGVSTIAGLALGQVIVGFMRYRLAPPFGPEPLSTGVGI